MANIFTQSALHTAISSLWRANNAREITGPLGGDTLHNIVDTVIYLAVPAKILGIALTDNQNNDIELHKNAAGAIESIRLMFRIKSATNIITGLVEIVKRDTATYELSEPLGRQLYGEPAIALSDAIQLAPVYTAGDAGALTLRATLTGAGSTATIDLFDIRKLTV